MPPAPKTIAELIIGKTICGDCKRDVENIIRARRARHVEELNNIHGKVITCSECKTEIDKIEWCREHREEYAELEGRIAEDSELLNEGGKK